MASNKHNPLSYEALEGISKIMGHTTDGLTGSEIEYELLKVHVPDNYPCITKWKRLYNAFIDYQNERQCSNNILNFCINYFQPSRYVNTETDNYKEQLIQFNRIMAFEGWQINEQGKLLKKTKSTSISEVNKRINRLKSELQSRGSHPQVYRYCNPELLVENYFHSVEEAVKGLFDRIKELAIVNSGDGAELIDLVFSTKNPILIINGYQTDTDKTIHKGFMKFLKGLYSMVRSPRCHTAKIKWDSEIQDCLDIFSMVSYCHRILDKAQKIR